MIGAMLRIACLYLVLAGLTLPFVHAQTPPPGAAKLQFIAMLNRHGVRTPLMTNEQLNEYSVEQWPKWNVPLGALTEHGRTQLKLIGTYNREYYTKTGLLGSGGCAEAGQFYFYSDVTPRNIESAKWMAEGLFPDCNAKIYSSPLNGADPLFHLFDGFQKPDTALWAAALVGRLGGHPEYLDAMYRSRLEILEEVFLGCRPGPNCPADGKAPKRSLLAMRTNLTAEPGKIPTLSGPLSQASTMVEGLMMEWADGMPAKDIGWGRVNKEKLRELMFLQDAYIELAQRTPYAARAQGSNIMSHMLRSMEQAVTGKAVAGALGKAGDKGLIMLGHDTNMSWLAGILGVSWALEGYQPNGRPPGAALVFEIWKEASGKNTVRMYLSAQSLDQLHDGTPLTLQNPPLKAPIFIPGCSTAAAGWPCDWEAFKRKVERDIDPAFVSATPANLVTNTLR